MNKTVLFLCPHHAAKSVIAEAYFNQMARQNDLPFVANSAGTEPDTVVSPTVVDMLGREGLDVSSHQPRPVTIFELEHATRVISMGCRPEALGIEHVRVELWDDIPMVSQEPEKARAAIHAHVQQLIEELRVLSQ